MWELDHKEGWMPKNWYFWTLVLEKTIESPLDSKEIKSILKETSPEVPILWPLDVKSQLIRKDFDDGKDWREEAKGTPEDEMVLWHHQLIGHEFEQVPEDGDVQGSLACYSPWGHKVTHVMDMTEWLSDDEEEAEATEDEKGWWHHPLNEQEFEPNPGDSVG